MERRRKEEMKKNYICLLLLALLQITTASSVLNVSQNSTNTTTGSSTNTNAIYRTRPTNLTVAVGNPAEFRCGVPDGTNLVFSYKGKKNHSLTCPGGSYEDIPEALYGTCVKKDNELQAVWTLKGTSYSDNGTRVVCKAEDTSDTVAAVLHVYDGGLSKGSLAGYTIGGFFGMLLVFGLSYTSVRRSETLQKCFKGKEEEEDDINTIVTKD